MRKNANNIHTVAKLIASLSVVVFICAAIGCTMITVESEPPGADVYYSINGLRPWIAWPPGAEQVSQTPARVMTFADSVYMVQVVKDGYHPPTPQVVDAMRAGSEVVQFKLIEEGADPTGKSETAAGASSIDVARAFGDTPAPPRPAPTIEDITPANSRPSERATQMETAKIGELVEKIFALGGDRLTTPTKLANLGEGTPRLKVLNGVGEPMSLMLSGPSPLFKVLPPYKDFSFELAAGEYKLVMREQDAASTPSLTTLTLKPGDWYYVRHRRAPDRPTASDEEETLLRALLDTPKVEAPTYTAPEPEDGQKRPKDSFREPYKGRGRGSPFYRR